MSKIVLSIFTLIFFSCTQEKNIVPDYILTADQKHNKFSSAIPPVIKVPSGSVIKADTEEASDGQLHRKAILDDLKNIDDVTENLEEIISKDNLDEQSTN